MADNASTHTSHESAAPVLAFLGLSLSLILFAAAVAAMRATAHQTPSLTDSVVMLAIAGLLFWGSFTQFVRVMTGEDDGYTSPMRIAARLLRKALWFAFTPVAIYLGGRVVPTAPYYGWIIGTVVTLLLPYVARIGSGSGDTVIRGTALVTQAQARRRVDHITCPGEPTVNWVGFPLPERFSEQHFLFAGGTGSGKTVAQRMMMQSVLPGITPGSDCRAVVYDAKQDMIEILSGMSLSCDLIILNPFETRSVSWDLAKDITTPATALQLASIIIEDEKGQNSFFSKAARDLFAAVIVALHHTRPGDWTLGHVLSVLSSTERTHTLLEQVPYTRDAAMEHFQRDERTLANVQYTISANIASLRPVAALWHHADRRFSLRDWISSNSILVLGNMEDLRYPIDAINRALFQRLVELVLSQSESATRRTWFFLDELKEMGRLNALPRLLTKGRSKGVRAVLAFQTFEGLCDVYGDKLAGEISGMAANKCFLRTDSEETARWASRIIGEAEYEQWTRSVGPDGKDSRNQQIVKKDAVFPSQLLRLPLADRERFWSYCVTPSVGIYCGPTRFSHLLCSKGSAPNFVPRPDSEQYLPDGLYSIDDPEDPSLDEFSRMRFKSRPSTLHEDIEDMP